MGISSGSGLKMTFSSMKDDFIEARFDPKYRDLFQDELERFDSQKSKKIKTIPVKFAGEFEAKTRQAIQVLVDQVFYFSHEFNFELSKNYPEVMFFTPVAWQLAKKKSLGLKVILPAAKIDWELRTPIVQIILPEKVKTTDAVINTVRLLCSKLFGELYFKEKTAVRFPASQNTEKNSAVQSSIEEKLRFCRLLDKFPDQVEREFFRIGKESKIRVKPQQFGKSEFFKKIASEKEKSNSLFLKLLDDTYQEHLLFASSQKDKFIETVLSQLFTTLTQGSLILPHEKADFDFLKNKKDWTVFHALECRMELVVNELNDLKEALDVFKGHNSGSKLDLNLSGSMVSSIQERMKLLNKNGLVKVFFTNSLLLTKEQAFEKQQFPLWIWRNIFSKQEAAVTDSKKETKRITELYKNSVYQKLFEAWHRLKKSIQAMEQNPGLAFEKSSDYAEINRLSSWLDLRYELFLDILAFCRIGKKLAGTDNLYSDQKIKSIKFFEKGWSYFISFALIHQYYLKIAKRKENDTRDNQYFELINLYINQRVSNKAEFRLAALLTQVYRKLDYDLTGFSSFIDREAPVLDFFIFNQDKIFKKDDASYQNKIGDYGDNLIKWFKERERQNISPDELELLNASE